MPREYLFCSVLSWWNIKNRAVFTSQFSLCSEISVMLWITMMTNLVNELHLYIYEFIRLSTWEYKGTGILSHMYVSLLDSLTWLIINFGLNFILLSQIWPWNFNPTSRGRWQPKKKDIVKSSALKFNLYTWHMPFNHWATQSFSPTLRRKLSQVKYTFYICFFLYVILCIVKLT